MLGKLFLRASVIIGLLVSVERSEIPPGFGPVSLVETVRQPEVHNESPFETMVEVNLGSRRDSHHKDLTNNTSTLGEADHNPQGPMSYSPLGAGKIFTPHKWVGLCARGVVRSVEDFREVVKRDPRLQQWYKDFDWSKAYLSLNISSIPRYVSYRRGNDIAWTRKPVVLRHGEFIIRDGRTSLRADCCNEFEDKPQTPTRGDEPPPEVISPPPVVIPPVKSPPVTRSGPPLFPSPPTYVAPPGGGGWVPDSPTIWIGTPPSTTVVPPVRVSIPGFPPETPYVSIVEIVNNPPDRPGGDSPVSSVDEPSSSVLCIIGLMFCLLLRLCSVRWKGAFLSR